MYYYYGKKKKNHKFIFLEILNFFIGIYYKKCRLSKTP